MNPTMLFNAKMLEFMQDLIESFPHESEFLVCRDLMNVSISINKDLPQRIFQEHIASKYEQYLIDRNENFFLKESYDPSITDIRFVEKLKQMWKGLDAGNKDVVWKYMQCLVAINRKCLQKTQTI
jgi:uncharacterized protein (UPF0305 family)